jgi:hypothetical protein
LGCYWARTLPGVACINDALAFQASCWAHSAVKIGIGVLICGLRKDPSSETLNPLFPPGPLTPEILSFPPKWKFLPADVGRLPADVGGLPAEVGDYQQMAGLASRCRGPISRCRGPTSRCWGAYQQMSEPYPQMSGYEFFKVFANHGFLYFELLRGSFEPS